MSRHSSPSSSSLSRPFYFSQAHPMVKTVKGPGVDWPWLELPNLRKFLGGRTYNLTDLFHKFSFVPLGILSSTDRGANDTIEWIQSICTESLDVEDTSNMKFYSDQLCDELKSFLVPFQYSVSNRPDGMVLRTVPNEKFSLPILFVEVHSGEYKNSVSQIAVDVIDQLRLVRCFNCDITQCVGFMFPKYATEKSENKTCVTKVIATFEVTQEFLGFSVSIHPLHIEDVKKEASSALITAAEKIKYTIKPEKFFIRLSQSELNELGRLLLRDGIKLEVDDDETGQSVKKLTQIPSPHSVVLRSSHHFFKLVPNSFERDLVFEMLVRIQSSSSVPRHIAFPTAVLYPTASNIYFFRYDVYLPPLTSIEVATCLQDYLFKTAEALKELHETYERAHLDVRVPNICFSEQSPSKDHHLPSTSTIYYAVLIDVDRCQSIALRSTAAMYVGEMYRMPDDWDTGKLDWKQLGLLATRVIFTKKSDEDIVSNRVYKDDEFLCSLIDLGQWREDLWSSSELLKKYQSKPLDEILASRLQ